MLSCSSLDSEHVDGCNLSDLQSRCEEGVSHLPIHVREHESMVRHDVPSAELKSSSQNAVVESGESICS